MNEKDRTLLIRELRYLIQANQTKEVYEHTPSPVREEIHKTIKWLCAKIRED